MSYEISRDCDLRGFWVGGMQKVKYWGESSIEMYEGEIFIPDTLLKELDLCCRELRGK